MAVLSTVVPFISQMLAAPLVFVNNRSLRPSPLKSPSPLRTVQPENGPNHAELSVVVPFISHIAAVPLAFRHSRSLLPSPLKSSSAAPRVHLGNLNDAIRVFQLNWPVVFRYSLVYQKVQSSVGSIVML